MRKIDPVTIKICKISFECVSLFIKVSENINNSFASLGLFWIQNLMTGHIIAVHLQQATVHVHILNFDMGQDKVKIHSTYTVGTISGWSFT